MKIFIYTDNDTDVSFEDVFLSTIYKDIKHFKKENPDLKPLLSYNVKDVLGFDIEKLQADNKTMREALEKISETDITNRPPDMPWLAKWRNNTKERAREALKKIKEMENEYN